MSLDSGKLRHRVTIQAPTQVQDPNTGAVVPSWSDVAEVWAAIEPLSAREFIQSQATQSQVTARITIRYNANVTALCRVIHNGKIYNVHGVLADKDSGLEYITLPVSQGVNTGE